MKDRIPAPGKANRVRITRDDGTVIEGVLSYADDAIQIGSRYTKGNVLPDEVCDALHLDKETAELKDALLALPAVMGKARLKVSAYQVDGTPFANAYIEGLTGVAASNAHTDGRGRLSVYVNEGDYTLSIPSGQCLDASVDSVSVSVSAGETREIVLRQVASGVTSATITTGGAVRFSSRVSAVDVFCVGGGASGGTGNNTTASPYVYGDGGGGGYTATMLHVSVVPLLEYLAEVGAGGKAPGEYNSAGNPGGDTSFLGVVARGGAGKNGGSGGGAAGYTRYTSNTDYYYYAGNGGEDGENGGDAKRNGTGEAYDTGGIGQGTTTRAFGEAAGALYAGGGAGGGDGSATGGAGGGGSGAGNDKPASNGAPYTGGGGGGAYSGNLNAGDGGSGVILVRWM